MLSKKQKSENTHGWGEVSLYNWPPVLQVGYLQGSFPLWRVFYAKINEKIGILKKSYDEIDHRSSYRLASHYPQINSGFEYMRTTHRCYADSNADSVRLLNDDVYTYLPYW